jgi:hypothetical protein
MTTALRVMELATESYFMHDHRVLPRATCAARQGSQILLGLLITLLALPEVLIVEVFAQPLTRV